MRMTFQCVLPTLVLRDVVNAVMNHFEHNSWLVYNGILAMLAVSRKTQIIRPYIYAIWLYLTVQTVHGQSY